MRSVLLLLSGGVDSSVLAGFAQRRSLLLGALFIDYGQPAALQEFEAAESFCEHRKIQILKRAVEIDASGLKRGAGVVPGRNAILVATGASIAVSMEASEVWIGLTADDWADYPDCRGSFVEAIDKVTKIFGVSVRAPFLGMRRPDILDMARFLPVSLHDCWSCFTPESGAPCGKCPGCQRERLP